MRGGLELHAPLIAIARVWCWKQRLREHVLAAGHRPPPLRLVVHRDGTDGGEGAAVAEQLWAPNSLISATFL